MESDDWGMCCGEEEAKLCVESWYERQEKDNDTLTVIKWVLFVAVVTFAIFAGTLCLADTAIA